MPKEKWVVNVNGQEHTIEVKVSRWTLVGEILVDGRVRDAWGLTFNLTQRRFTVAGKEAIIRWPGVIASNRELFVDGSKIR